MNLKNKFKKCKIVAMVKRLVMCVLTAFVVAVIPCIMMVVLFAALSIFNIDVQYTIIDLYIGSYVASIPISWILTTPMC